MNIVRHPASENPKISVIVPIYNTEKYLNTCVKSILNQTLKEIEIILVNDGSQDNSGAICDEYADKDSRVKVLHKNNGGLSSARNAGINIASGEFIAFIDSDDFICKEMLKKMFIASQSFDVEIVSCGYKKCDEGGNVYSKHLFPLDKNKRIKQLEMKEILTKAHQSRFTWFVWRNIYKRSLLCNNSLQFNTDLKFAEDSIFNMYAFYYAASSMALEESLYYYRVNPTSLTLKKGKEYLESNLMLQYEEKLKYYKKFSFNENAIDDLRAYVVEHQLPMLLQNASLVTDNKQQTTKYKEILSKEMITDTLPKYNLSKLLTVPLGIRIVILLSKYNLIFLLKKFLNSKLK